MSLSQSIPHANISERLTWESSRRKTREPKAPKILLPQAEKKNCTPPLRTSDFTRLETILSHPWSWNWMEKYNKKIVALANDYDIVKDTVITWTTATLSRLSEIFFLCNEGATRCLEFNLEPVSKNKNVFVDYKYINHTEPQHQSATFSRIPRSRGRRTSANWVN